jgi:hypothetical protein
MTEFSGGQVFFNPANDPANDKIIDGDKELIKREKREPHAWIAATSHPLPELPAPPPPPNPHFQLTVQHLSERSKTGEGMATANAACADMAQLLELNDQFEALGYHFVKLERITPQTEAD